MSRIIVNVRVCVYGLYLFIYYETGFYKVGVSNFCRLGYVKCCFNLGYFLAFHSHCQFMVLYGPSGCSECYIECYIDYWR
jgi:hypothetical protein